MRRFLLHSLICSGIFVFASLVIELIIRGWDLQVFEFVIPGVILGVVSGLFTLDF